MERGLITVERKYLRQRAQMYLNSLRSYGIVPVFGGTGEGTGFGGGLTYLAGQEKPTQFRLDLKITTANYQEASLSLGQALGPGKLFFEGSYQWRPKENFYGLGHDTKKGQRTNFALRQTWTGVRYEASMRHGSRPAAKSSGPGWKHLPAPIPPFHPRTSILRICPATIPDAIAKHRRVCFPERDSRRLPAWRSAPSRRLLSGWAWTQQAPRVLHLRNPDGGAPADGFRAQRLCRPGKPGIQPEKGRQRPIPFYLLPHIGGSSTLRGFRLDRFYGTNLFLLSLEYRYRLHPNIEAIPFFDEGQIFDQTADLSWLNWHRNYGLGFRYRAGVEKRTVLRLELGHSSEGIQFHLSFGDRPQPRLSGPIRWGAYRP